MAPFLKSGAQRIALGVTALLMGAIGFLPLFGGPGYEHALASGLLLPSAAAITTSLELSADRAPAPLASLGRGVLCGCGLALVSFATSLAHGARVGLCDLAGGAFGFLLTAGVGAALGGAWGVVVAEVARGLRRRKRACVALALVAPLVGIGCSVLRFYTSPMIFAFDPFFGYFSGTLYDTVIDPGNALLSYRAGSLATLASGALLASVLTRDEAGRLRWAPLRGSAASGTRALFGAVLCAASLGVTLSGAKLGHWQTSETIAEDLGGRRAGPRCAVIFPDSMRDDESALLVKDCEEELASVEAALGARGPEHVKAIFFRDAGDKKRLMGAGDTYIAKPWRGEVYLQVAPYPHPVLGHELAHVVSGSFGRGPFRIAGALGGLWPNPGLIEGVAVAASPDDEELSDAQWAHALIELGKLPRLSTVFSFDFFAAPAAKSYTVAGAFVRWILDQYGGGTVRAWYAGASLEELTRQSWSALDEQFREAVKRTPLAPEADSYAKAKFEHPAIFGRKCPHVVDGLRQKADHCRDAHQVDKAVALYGEVLSRDPHDWGAHYGRGVTRLRFGDADRGRQELSQIEGDGDAPRTWRDRTSDALADADLLAGRIVAASERYQRLAEHTLDEDFGRTEEVKRLEAGDWRGRPAVLALLLGAPGRPNDLVFAAVRLGQWYEATHDAVAAYLIGKNLAQRGWLAEASGYLDAALAAGPAPTLRIGREMIRQRAFCACALSDAAAVARARDAVGSPTGPYAESEGRKDMLLRLLVRCQAR